MTARPTVCPIVAPTAVCMTPDRNPGCCTGCGITTGGCAAFIVFAGGCGRGALVVADLLLPLYEELDERDERPGAIEEDNNKNKWKE